MTAGRVLVVDDAPDTLDIIEQNLTSRGYDVVAVSSAREALRLLAARPFELVVTDMKMPGMSGLELVKHVRERHPDTEVMMITGYATIEGAVEAVKTGAEEYLAKPFTDDELLCAVDRALEKLRSRGKARAGESGRFGLVGRSSAIRAAFAAMDRASRHGNPVLVLGEPGTGRWAAVRAIAARSREPAAAFMLLDAASDDAAWPDDPASALGGAAGLFVRDADQAGPAVQGKLRKLVASHASLPARVYVSASGDLPVLASAGLFAQELCEMLSGATVALPPLRQRGDDVALLAEHFARVWAVRQGQAAPAFAAAAMGALESYAWPGNVRELLSAVQGAPLRSAGREVGVADLPEAVRAAAASGTLGTLAEAEAAHILRVLAHAGGNRRRASEILHIDRKTLRLKLRELGHDSGEGD
ncbi:MAG: sigma-54-dependent Fis family transcriptional regulator [Candidatus Riflebacteria bacterium]|nr:sigma-54-dependent Fis family transcriptional regulator [Candidatus Riflebacteria bacterium]